MMKEIKNWSMTMILQESIVEFQIFNHNSSDVNKIQESLGF